jgi:hypothetical protein
MRRYLDGAFELGARLGLEYHGLGMTSPWIMLDFPWKSIDSSSWSRVAGFGSIMDWDQDTGRLTTLHVSRRNSGAAKLHGSGSAVGCVREHVEARGYDFGKLRRNLLYRHQYNAMTMAAMAKSATRRHAAGGGYRWRHLI